MERRRTGGGLTGRLYSSYIARPSFDSDFHICSITDITIPTVRRHKFHWDKSRAEPAMARNQQNLPFQLRNHGPGDMGLIIHHHGVVYSAEPYRWNQTFESLVARITADFIDNFDPKKERCWIAERDGDFLGCIMLVQDPNDKQVAKIRLLLVKEEARGMGLATQLIQECIKFAREANYTSISLWTQSILEGARRLYKRAGFELAGSEEHESFGHHLVGEYWKMVL